MEHITKAATVTATTDAGEFTAIAAAYTLDRVNDRIVPGAFAKTIAQWKQSGKRVPLHWNHQGEASNIIGSLDPESMVETDDGLKVAGRLDLADSEVAKEAWRSMKGGSMSLSFGYLVTRQKKGKDGANELHELDLFEVSIVPAPANPDTRILSMKSVEADRLSTELQEVKARLDSLEKALEDQKNNAEETDKEPQARSVDPLRDEALKTALEIRTGGLGDKPPVKQVVEPKPDPVDPDVLYRESHDLMVQVLSGKETT